MGHVHTKAHYTRLNPAACIPVVKNAISSGNRDSEGAPPPGPAGPPAPANSPNWGRRGPSAPLTTPSRHVDHDELDAAQAWVTEGLSQNKAH
jgi:hypothetical protein